jgi:hypothetical protein
MLRTAEAVQQALEQPGGDWDDMPIHSAAFGGHPDVIDIWWRLGANLECIRFLSSPKVISRIELEGGNPVLCTLRTYHRNLWFIAEVASLAVGSGILRRIGIMIGILVSVPTMLHPLSR